MSSECSLNNLEKCIVNDPKRFFTLTCYVLVMAIYMNLETIKSPAIGIVAFTIYFLINAAFLGSAFFSKEATFFRLMFGLLLLIMLLGFAGWLALLIYNLDTPKVILVLLVTSTLSSLSNKKRIGRDAT